MRPPKQAQIVPWLLITLLLLSVFVPTTAFAASSSTAKKQKLQRQKSLLQSRIRTVRKRLHLVKVQENQTRRKLRGVEHQLRVARGEYNTASLRYQRAKIELQRANLALTSAKSQLTDAQEDVGDRLVVMHHRGDQGFLELLVSSESIDHMLQRAELARLSMHQDQEALDNLKAQKDRVAKYQQHVQVKTAEVAAWKRQVAVRKARTDVERYRVAGTLSKVHNQRESIEAELAALERDSREVASMLRRMMASSSGRRRYNRVYAGPVSGMPVAGRITSGFGYRFHPVLRYRRMHTGVDIGAPTGTPIHASGGGYVIWAARRGGYGNTVIIDHGGGKATLYAHMSRIAVRVGQTVSRRQIVGYVGSTGISTGPHLHYEVRINGEPVNPL